MFVFRGSRTINEINPFLFCFCSKGICVCVLLPVFFNHRDRHQSTENQVTYACALKVATNKRKKLRKKKRFHSVFFFFLSLSISSFSFNDEITNIRRNKGVTLPWWLLQGKSRTHTLTTASCAFLHSLAQEETHHWCASFCLLLHLLQNAVLHHLNLIFEDMQIFQNDDTKKIQNQHKKNEIHIKREIEWTHRRRGDKTETEITNNMLLYLNEKKINE